MSPSNTRQRLNNLAYTSSPCAELTAPRMFFVPLGDFFAKILAHSKFLLYLCTMKRLLDNYIFDDTLRYENHQLLYTPADGETIMLQGILGASILSALLLGTEEGTARGITFDTLGNKQNLFIRYERETIREGWGLLEIEIQLLSNAYIELAISDVELPSLFPNERLYNEAMEMTVGYMRYLVNEYYREHIYEFVPWEAPFSRWFLHAALDETKRHYLIHMPWNDPTCVTMIEKDLTQMQDTPTFSFEGEAADNIMSRYLEWVTTEYVSIVNEVPDTKPNLTRHRKFIVRSETHPDFTSEEKKLIRSLSPDDRELWNTWLTEWEQFVRSRLGQTREVLFWSDTVSEQAKQHLIYRMQLQEQHPAHYRELTTTIYAMRQLGLIRKGCKTPDILRWLSENLSIDYTLKNNAFQFRRAWEAHGRYTPEVRLEVEYIKDLLGTEE